LSQKKPYLLKIQSIKIARGLLNSGGLSATKQETVQSQETKVLQEQEIQLQTPFCEANLNFVHNELLYILHPRMPIGDTVYIENAP
jgi:hypothetical protein